MESSQDEPNAVVSVRACKWRLLLLHDQEAPWILRDAVLSPGAVLSCGIEPEPVWHLPV